MTRAAGPAWRTVPACLPGAGTALALSIAAAAPAPAQEIVRAVCSSDPLSAGSSGGPVAPLHLGGDEPSDLRAIARLHVVVQQIVVAGGQGG
jgi:hypothetical protein